MKHLAKVGREIEKKLEKKAQHYNKSSPGEMVHFDTKRLPRLKNQSVADPFGAAATTLCRGLPVLPGSLKGGTPFETVENYFAQPVV